jgi:hypothetical protein
MNAGEILALEDLLTSSMGELGFEPGENEGGRTSKQGRSESTIEDEHGVDPEQDE